ncbi:non-specific lipid-transfer protein 1 [Arachis duranensis]|uniref:Non-specific lipid-transfer protein n=1 Tax=Arachis duranensis TaxID=130453 RepID=A0A6P4CFZ0_ARADU|nr:non-specific lipid-transfer protein 1 [Arachis duranensis]
MAKLAPCVVLMLCMAIVGAPIAKAAIQCSFVTKSIAPCFGYLKSGGTVSGPCCSGIQNINGTAKTTSDRQAVCNCLKSVAGSLGSQINLNNAASLPGKCGVSIPYKISTSTNCSSIK